MKNLGKLNGVRRFVCSTRNRRISAVSTFSVRCKSLFFASGGNESFSTPAPLPDKCAAVVSGSNQSEGEVIVINVQP